MTPTQAVVNLRTLVSTMESMLTEKRLSGVSYLGWRKSNWEFFRLKSSSTPSVILAVPKRLNQSVITLKPEKRPIHAPCLPLARCSYLRRAKTRFAVKYWLSVARGCHCYYPAAGLIFSLTCAGTSSSSPWRTLSKPRANVRNWLSLRNSATEIPKRSATLWADSSAPRM